MWCVSGHVSESRNGPYGAFRNVRGETQWQPKPAMSCCYPSNCPLWPRLLSACGCRFSVWPQSSLSFNTEMLCHISEKLWNKDCFVLSRLELPGLGLCCLIIAVLMETVPPVCSIPSLSPVLRPFFPSPSLHIWKAHGAELSATAESTYLQGSSDFPLNILYTYWVFFHAYYLLYCRWCCDISKS